MSIFDYDSPMPRGILGAATTNASSAPVDLEQAMRKLYARLNYRPEPVWRIMAHHAVPYGKGFRQYRTDGRLLVWLNRGQIAGMPRAAAGSVLSGDLAYGIPVENA